MDGGSACTAMQTYFMPMRYTLKNGYSAKFLCHVYFMAIKKIKALMIIIDATIL